MVSATTDPDQTYEDLFSVELTPVDLKFPEGFFIWRGLTDVKDLEEYLNEGSDQYSWAENYHGDPEEDEFIKAMPKPLNKTDSVAFLKWTLQDVSFDRAAYVLLKVYHTYHTKEMLEEKTVGELRIIARVKKAHLAQKKPQLIQNILVKQSTGEWSIYGLTVPQSTGKNFEFTTISRLLWKHPIRHGIEQEIQKKQKKSCMVRSRASNNQRIRERRKKEMETKITPTECKLCDLKAPQAPEGNVPADVWSTLENKLTQMET